MKSSEMLNQIKTLLNIEVKFEEMKLENGTVVEAESFEKGKEIFIKTDDEKVAMPVGEYMLEDSRLLVVEEEGIIADMREVSDEVPQKEEEDGKEITEDLKEDEYEDEEEMRDDGKEAAVDDWQGMEKRIKNLEDAIADLKAKEPEKEEMSADELGNLLTEELAKHEKTELSEVPNEVQAELDKPAAEPIVSNPETNENLSKFKIGSKRPMNTMDRILQQFNK